MRTILQNFSKSLLWVFGLLFCATVFAQIPFTAAYTFGADGNVSSFNYNGTNYEGLQMGPALKVGITSSSSSNNFRGSNWPLGATTGSDVFSGSLDTGKYIQFSMANVAGYKYTVTSINFGIGRSATGIRQSQWRGSHDAFGAAIDNYTNVASGLTNASGVLTNPDANSSWVGNILDVSALYTDQTTTSTFRLYLYNSESTTGTAGLQGNITISGTYELVALNDPTIITSVASLNDYGGIIINSNSPSQNFTVNASNLQEGVLITAPTGFQVSPDDATFSQSFTLPQTSGAISNALVYVRFSPTNPGGTNGNITLQSAGALTQNVSVSGTGEFAPIDPPVATAATMVGFTSFQANWQTVEGATSYRLDVSLSPTFEEIIPATDLLISEYVEGSSSNKYIEIFNGTGTTVDLSNYALQLYANGNTSTSNVQPLSGTLANGATLVYRNSLADLPGTTGYPTSGVCNFNGDDAVTIFNITTNTLVDVIGRIGSDPGTAWTAPGFSTENKTLARKPTVSSGIAINPPGPSFPTLETEWIQFDIDNVDNLGSHSYTAATPSFVAGYENLTVNGLSQEVTGLVANTTYYYRVRAFNGNTSSNSNVIAVTTDSFPSIGLAGTFNNFTDEVMSTNDGTTYTLSAISLPANTVVKFRQDGSWEINWGGTAFPSGTGVQNGPDIPVNVGGSYDVTFNRTTGAYNFELLSEPFQNIGIIGEFNGWSQSVPMTTIDGIAYNFTDLYITPPGNDPGLKFRENNSWDAPNVNWGGTTFPAGTAVPFGQNIPATNGYYNVSFNATTLAYNFQQVPISIIGTGALGWETDVLMTSTDGGITSVLEQYQLQDGFVKFRANQNWTTNWGGSNFPIGAATLDGANIPVQAGVYNIYFNRLSQVYLFELLTEQTYYQDLDGDNYGNSAVSVVAYSQPDGYVLASGDCDDTNAVINPGATEVCFDGVDSNCDGNDSEACPVVVNIIRNCGVTITQPFAYITCNMQNLSAYGSGFTLGYRFKVTNTVTNTTVELDRAVNNFNLSMVSNFAYNTAFIVEAAAIVNGYVQPYLGSICTITTPAIATNQIGSSQCGSTFTELNPRIKASAIFGAIHYRFRVALSEAPTTYEYYISPYPSMRLNALTQLPLNYGKTYLISVQAWFNNNGVEGYTDFGSECAVSTPPVSSVSLYPVECGQTLVASNSRISAGSVPSATLYRCRVALASNPGVTEDIIAPYPRFRLSSLTGTVPFLDGTQYLVSVQAEVTIDGNVFLTTFGVPCLITTPSGEDQILTKEVLVSELQQFAVIAYPNPFKDAFAINIKTNATAPIQMAIYDMTGRLLEAKTLTVDQVNNTPMGSNYPSGVYQVVVSQGDQLQTIRVIKQ